MANDPGIWSGTETTVMMGDHNSLESLFCDLWYGSGCFSVRTRSRDVPIKFDNILYSGDDIGALSAGG